MSHINNVSVYSNKKHEITEYNVLLQVTFIWDLQECFVWIEVAVKGSKFTIGSRSINTTSIYWYIYFWNFGRSGAKFLEWARKIDLEICNIVKLGGAELQTLTRAVTWLITGWGTSLNLNVTNILRGVAGTWGGNRQKFEMTEFFSWVGRDMPPPACWLIRVIPNTYSLKNKTYTLFKQVW